MPLPLRVSSHRLAFIEIGMRRREVATVSIVASGHEIDLGDRGSTAEPSGTLRGGFSFPRALPVKEPPSPQYNTIGSLPTNSVTVDSPNDATDRPA